MADENDRIWKLMDEGFSMDEIRAALKSEKKSDVSAFATPSHQGTSHTKSYGQSTVGEGGLVTEPTEMTVDLPLPIGPPGGVVKLTTPKMPASVVNTAAAVGKTLSDIPVGLREHFSILTGLGDKDKQVAEVKERNVRDAPLVRDYPGTIAMADALESVLPQTAALRYIKPLRVGADAAAKIPAKNIAAVGGMGALDALRHPTENPDSTDALIKALIGTTLNVGGEVGGRLLSHGVAPRSYRGGRSPAAQADIDAMTASGYPAPPPGNDALDTLRRQYTGTFESLGGKQAADDAVTTRIATGRVGQPMEFIDTEGLARMKAEVENTGRAFHNLGPVPLPPIPKQLSSVAAEIEELNAVTNQSRGPRLVEKAREGLTPTVDNTPNQGPGIYNTINESAIAAHPMPIGRTLEQVGAESGLQGGIPLPPSMSIAATGAEPTVDASLLMGLREHASNLAYGGESAATRNAARQLQTIYENAIRQHLDRIGQGVNTPDLGRVFDSWKRKHGAMKDLERSIDPAKGGLNLDNTVNPQSYMREMSDDARLYQRNPDDAALVAAARRAPPRKAPTADDTGAHVAQAAVTAGQSYNPMLSGTKFAMKFLPAWLASTGAGSRYLTGTTNSKLAQLLTSPSESYLLGPEIAALMQGANARDIYR